MHSVYAPLSVRLVQQLEKPGWRNIRVSFVLTSVDGPITSPKINNNRQVSLKSNTKSNDIKILYSSFKPPVLILKQCALLLNIIIFLIKNHLLEVDIQFWFPVWKINLSRYVKCSWRSFFMLLRRANAIKVWSNAIIFRKQRNYCCCLSIFSPNYV